LHQELLQKLHREQEKQLEYVLGLLRNRMYIILNELIFCIIFFVTSTKCFFYFSGTTCTCTN
jgi:hypothetical protein